jgi:hypothetical protein
MRNFHCIVALLLFIFTVSITNAQKKPAKFGDIDINDLQAKVCSLDSSADAEIICDFGYFNSNDFTFTRYLRVKIYKNTAYDRAAFALPAVDNIYVKGFTYNWEDGKIIKTKLSSECIKNERIIRNVTRKRVAFPNIKEGSIFEIEYTYNTFPSEWLFQDLIPIRISELRIDESNLFSYRKRAYGSLAFDKWENGRWVVSNVKPFNPEPFIDTYKNYISKFEFEIQDISIPGRLYKNYCQDWTTVSEKFRGYFSSVFEMTGFIKDIAEEISVQKKTPLEKLKNAYEATKVIKWNEYENTNISEESLKTVYKNKVGNSADINLFLLQLLKKMKIDAYPVLLRTKDDGTISKSDPTIEQFNYVIVGAKIDTSVYLMDATEQLMPFGMLPERCFGSNGLAIHENSIEWKNLYKSAKKELEMENCSLVLNQDGTISGNINQVKYDYSAFNFRKHFKTLSSKDDYIAEIEKRDPGVSVKNLDIQNLDSINKPITNSIDIKIKNKTLDTGDTIYLNPITIAQKTENPFKLEKRDLPVIYSYPINYAYIARIKLPENYKVVQLPKSIRVITSNNKMKFSYSTQVNNNQIEIAYKFSSDDVFYASNSYGEIRELYNQIIKKHAEQVVIAKK